jgi:phage shock protein A
MPELEVLEAHVPVRTSHRDLGLVKVEESATARLAPIATWFSGPVFSRARDIFAANMTELLDRSEDPAKMIRMIILEMEETATARLAPIATWFSGPVFSRARDIFAANMTELLDRSEDPAKMIRMIILEMEETLVEVRATAARSIADIKEMRRAVGRLDEIKDNWTAKAELALSKDREDLAKAALMERQKAADMAESLRGEMDQIEQVLRGYEADIAKLQAKLREARARQNAIAARFESAVTRARTNEVMHGSRTLDAFAKFEVLERRADFAEGRAEALGITSLEDEIHELKAVEAVDRELEAMKAALKARMN